MSSLSGPLSNTARTRLLINSEELPWSRWAAQFREKMPKEIRNLMDEVASRNVQKVDREEIKRRIEELQELYNPSRYRFRAGGKVRVSGASVVDNVPSGFPSGFPPGFEQGQIWDRPSSGEVDTIPESIYTAFIKEEDGVEAEKIGGKPYPEIRWVSVEDGTRDPQFIEDRAANYAKEANFLSINADFRIFDDLITLLDIRNPDVPGGRQSIEERIKRHVEMALIETIFTS